MKRLRLPLIALGIVFILAVAGRESHAVIYKYMNVKGVPTFTDDLQKIPEQYRTQAVIVSGPAADEKDEQERTRLAAEERGRQEQSAAPAAIEEPVSKRLIRSGVAIGIFIAVMFVVSNIDVLKEQARVLLRIRTSLVLLLFLFLGITHARDVTGLFGKVGDRVANPVAGIQEMSADRGRKAAETYKAMDRVMEQQAQDEEARRREIEKKFEAAEQGK